MSGFSQQQQLFAVPSSTPANKPANKKVDNSHVAADATYAQVLVHIEAKGLDTNVFTYVIPEDMKDTVQVGVSVMVPFGRQPAVTGFVVAVEDTYTGKYKLKAIGDVLDDTPMFTEEYYQFLAWVAEYYVTPLPAVLATALPANLVQKVKKKVRLKSGLLTPQQKQALDPMGLKLVEHLEAKSDKSPKGFSPKHLARVFNMTPKDMNTLIRAMVKKEVVEIDTRLSGTTAEKTEQRVHLLEDPYDFEPALTKRQIGICEGLQKLLEKYQSEGAPHTEVLSACKTTPPTLKKLSQMGVIAIANVAVHRDPLSYYNRLEFDETKKTLTLNEGQQKVVDKAHASPPNSTHLLYGVTGSGKTEVYMELTRNALAKGQSAMILVPEIALTSHLSKRFIAYFGTENVALWHSNLSAGEKADTWRRLATGKLNILIAARSGIWAPMKNLGLICIDEEHDGSYKQDAPEPRYDARTLAEYLIQHRPEANNAKLVFGSATPDMATFYNAQKNDTVLPMPERYAGRALPTVQIVSMTQERMAGHKGYLSRLLIEEIQKNLKSSDEPTEREQTIILINRRGFYTSTRCKHCEYMFTCPQCDVAMTMHRPADSSRHKLRCHYCAHEEPTPQFCPQCASNAIGQAGVGTQRVEEEIKKRFPDVRTLRLDSDTLTKKDAHREIFDAFSAGEADVLIGTQMVAKGLDIHRVTLVGVVAADSTFNLPDFKSSERGFQMMTQVAGRAGRGEKPGRVVIQAIQPAHSVIRFGQAQDFDGFYEEEIEIRKVLSFPPFSQLFRFIISSTGEQSGWRFSQASAEHLKVAIKNAGLEEHMDVVGPASCVIARIQGRYRFHMMIKNRAGEQGHEVIRQFYQSVKPPEDMRFLLDVDAISLM